MKKALIGMAVSTILISGASPVFAGVGIEATIPPNPDSNLNSDDSIWEIVDGQTVEFGSAAIFGEGILADLILIAGMATMLDTCGNGEPFYTLFAPVEGVYRSSAVGGLQVSLNEYLDEVLGASVADLQAQPAIVRGLLNDHLVNGSFSPWQLDLDAITTLTARSGFTLRNENGASINDLSVLESEQACNGWVYGIFGVIDSTPQVPTEGLNSLDTPQDGTPGGSNSLPDTL